MKKFGAIISLLLMLAVPFSAFALTAKSGESVLIDEAVQTDLYVAAGSVRVAEAVNGDVLAAGGNLNMSGAVTGDVLGLAGDVVIDGDISDDVRMVAGSVSVNATIGGDLILVGGQTYIDADAVINGDLVVFGGMTEMWGTVKGDILVMGGELGIYGTVEGNVKAELDNQLRVSDKTSIKGNLVYDAPKAAEVTATMVGGEIIFGQKIVDRPEMHRGGLWEMKASAIAFSLLTTLVLGLLLMLMVPNLVAGSVVAVKEKPLMTVLIGFAVVPAALFAILLCFISVIGIKLGLLLMIKLAGMLLVAKIFAAYFAGSLILRSKKKLKTIEHFGVFALGLIAIELLTLVPYLGSLVQAAALLLGLGAMCMAAMTIYKRLKKEHLV